MRLSLFILKLVLIVVMTANSVFVFSIKYRVCHGSLERYSSVGLQGSTYSWKIENLKGESFTSAIKVYYRNGDSIDIRWNVPIDTFVLKVQEITQYNCNSVYVGDTIVIAGDYFDFPKDSIYICENSTGTITAPGNFNEYIWSTTEISKSIQVSKAQKYTVQANSSDGCLLKDSIWVKVRKNPILDIGPKKLRLCGEYNNRIILSVPEKFNNITWSTGDTTRTLAINLNFEPFKNITVKASDTSGCFGSDTIQLNKCDPNLFAEKIPTAFTPNGDGQNDVWDIPNIVDFDINNKCIVEIYDRWGRMVFKSDRGYPKPWTGRTADGRKLPVDAYYFIIDFKDGSDPLTGSVTLLR